MFASNTLAAEPDPVRSAELIAPVPIRPGQWVTTEDRLASGSEGEGVTRFELIISPEGAVVGCDVTQSSGFTVLDRLTCALLSDRGHFRPARDQHGQAIASTWRNLVRWIKPEHAEQIVPPPPPTDLDLVVNRLPAGATSPARVELLTVAGPNGALEACTGKMEKGSEALTKVACAQLTNFGLIADFQSHHPPTQRIMRTYIVQFSIDPGIPSR